MATFVTDSGVTIFGNAVNRFQTDQIYNAGVGNTFIGIGGNIDITGFAFPFGSTPTDSNTTIDLNSSGGAISHVNDTFSLDGYNNALYNTAAINHSTIHFSVLGDGSSNYVELGAASGDPNVSGSTVSVKIGVDPSATAPGGYNYVNIDNTGGTNNVDAGGPNNTVVLNGDATNSVTLGGGGAIVTIGYAGDGLSTYSSTVNLTGAGDTFTGGDENFTINGHGMSGAMISAGNGNDIFNLGGGADNTVTAGTGNDTVTASGTGDMGTFGPGDDTVSSTRAGTWTFNDNANDMTTATLGSGNTVDQNNGALDATLNGNRDTLNLNDTTSGTSIDSNGNLETFAFTNNASGSVTLNPVSSGDQLSVTGSSNDYTGTVSIADLNSTNAVVTLADLYTPGGVAITSFSQMLSDLHVSATGDVLPLLGGGEIKFAAGTTFSASSFKFA